MKYLSTRGGAPELGFEDVLLAGLARDGGLYLPAVWPQFSTDQIRKLAGRPYGEVAFEVMRPYLGGEIGDAEFRGIIDEAYATFSHTAIAPLVQLGPNDWLLELFHGPTLAFKDVAMQLLARLMDRALAMRGRRATVIGATSGDTGSAAINAFKGREAIDIFILHPHGRTSEVQRRQMTSASEANVHNIAVDGTFDDCQNLVKALFNDHSLRDRLGLAGVNSINWARIMAQTVYYFTSAVALGGPDRAISYAVPTGNFGDILAGHVARQMGLPIETLLIATNVNDILARTLATGRYEPQGVHATASPSMDIQISSNFERLLYELAGRDAARVVALMNGLAQGGGFTLSPGEQAALAAGFAAARTDEVATLETIASVHRQTGYVLDPHTAVAVHAAREFRRDPAMSANLPMVTLATAHPAKFPDTVAAAIGHPPERPARLEAQLSAAERLTVLANDYREIAGFIEARSRAGEALA